MRSVVAIEELRSVSNLTAPPLTTSERTSTRWHPEHHAAAVEIWAPEEPLRTAKSEEKSV
jgi:hypothetical protein